MDCQIASQKRPSSDNFDRNLNQDNKRVALQHLSLPQQVFSTQMILETILGNVTRKQLFQLRSLNTAWNSGACKLLSKKQAVNVHLQFDEYPVREIPPYFVKSVETKIQMLTETMTTSTSAVTEIESLFPHCRFLLYCLELRCAVTQNFLSSCGQVIQNLSFNFSYYTVGIEDDQFLVLLRNLLFDQLPNLRQLGIDVDNKLLPNRPSDYVQQFLLESGVGQKSRVLRKLEQLSFSCTMHVPILRAIFKACPNLREIDMSILAEPNRECVLETVIAHGKEHLLSSLDLCLGNEDELGSAERFSETSLRLKKLYVRMCEQVLGQEGIIKGAKIINNLLISSAQTLESLDTQPFLMYSSFHVPRMPKLHSLQLTHYSGCQPLFPTNFKISHIFPRLRSFKIEMLICKRMDQRLFTEHFLGASYDDQVLTLRSIDFGQHRGEMCTLNLPRIFPNLMHVNMGWLSNINPALNVMWSLVHLKTLKFMVILGEGTKENLAMELETAFTGFSMENCKELATECEDINLVTVEPPRVNRSMLDAKCLRELHIKIDDCVQEERKSGNTALLSHITGRFALRLCPQVQVHIELIARNRNNMQSLVTDVQPVRPYARSVTEIFNSFPGNSVEYFPCSSCQF